MRIIINVVIISILIIITVHYLERCYFSYKGLTTMLFNTPEIIYLEGAT